MDKLIYNEVKKVLKDEVPEVKWIDMDYGQLDTTQRPAVALPCVLVASSINNTDTLYQNTSGYAQNCNTSVTITMAFDPLGATNTAVPEDVVSKSLQPYDIIDKVHKNLQGLETSSIEPLIRTSQGKKTSRNGLFQYQIKFTTTVLDEA